MSINLIAKLLLYLIYKTNLYQLTFIQTDYLLAKSKIINM